MPMAVLFETPVANVSGLHLVGDQDPFFILLGDPNRAHILTEEPFFLAKGGHVSTSVCCVV